MRTETQTVNIGEDMGPIDWSHDIAKDKPAIWREAEKNPDAFRFNGRALIKLCMYDGWPYWTSRPAILFYGPLGSEWTFFDSYAVHDDSILADGALSRQDETPDAVPGASATEGTNT